MKNVSYIDYPKFMLIPIKFRVCPFSLVNNDLEDNVHYVLSKKRKCEAILTNNIKDFMVFNIRVLNPKNRMLKSYIG